MRLQPILSVLLVAWCVPWGDAHAANPPSHELEIFLPDEATAARLQPLIDQLESDRFTQREAASKELGALPALPGFVRDLAAKESRPESRLRLHKLLASFPIDTENQRLTQVLQDIEKQGTKGLLDPIVRIMQRGVWTPENAALHGAARATATHDDLPLITRCLGEASQGMRRIGAAALGGLSAEDSDRTLAELLGDADPPTALLAAAAFALRQDIRCLPAYARLLDADDFLTRYQGHLALRGLTGQDFGYDPSVTPGARKEAADQWRKWSTSPDAAITGNLPRDTSVVLFNGQDLLGWEVFLGNPALEKSTAWEVKDGALHCTGREPGHLWTKTRYENYLLTLEYKLEAPGGDSGVGLLLTESEERDRNNPGYMEIQLLTGRAGDLYRIGTIQLEDSNGPLQFTSPRTHEVKDPAGQWNKLKVTVRGGAAEVEINGVTVNKTLKGPIGPGRIVLRNENNPISFRSLLLHPLDPPAEIPDRRSNEEGAQPRRDRKNR